MRLAEVRMKPDDRHSRKPMRRAQLVLALIIAPALSALVGHNVGRHATAGDDAVQMQYFEPIGRCIGLFRPGTVGRARPCTAVGDRCRAFAAGASPRPGDAGVGDPVGRERERESVRRSASQARTCRSSAPKTSWSGSITTCFAPDSTVPARQAVTPHAAAISTQRCASCAATYSAKPAPMLRLP